MAAAEEQQVAALDNHRKIAVQELATTNARITVVYQLPNTVQAAADRTGVVELMGQLSAKEALLTRELEQQFGI